MKIKITVLLSFILICFNLYSLNVQASSNASELKSGWKFYQEELISTASEARKSAIEVKLPIEFDDLQLSIEGYGTFIKTVTVPENRVNTQWGLELPFVYSAAAIYIDGQKLKEVGIVGENAQMHETNLQSVVVPFTPTAASFEIAIQLSSFNHIRGGFSGAPVVGEWEIIQKQFNMDRYITIFIGTIILIVGLATLLIGLMNRKDKLFLIFGLFAVDVAIRGLVAVPFIYHELPIALSYELATRIEYITTTTCFALYAIFIYFLYNRLFSKVVLYFNVIVLVTIAVLATFTTPEFFQFVFFSVFPFMIFFVFYNIWVMFKALKSKLQLAKSLLLGVLFVFVGLIIDFLTGMGVLYAPPLAGFMIALNVLIVLLSLCINYVKQVRILAQLNNELDEMVKQRTSQLNVANKELTRLVNIDALTGIYNRHKFNEVLYEDFAKIEPPYFSLIMLDIDEFKSYNDFYGHVRGDELIVQLAQIMQSILPEDVLLARYGGEEFAVILPGYTLTETEKIAENIRAVIENMQIESKKRDVGIVTVSLGCAEKVTDQIDSEKQLIEVADERLYHSKLLGRNRVTSESTRAYN